MIVNERNYRPYINGNDLAHSVSMENIVEAIGGSMNGFVPRQYQYESLNTVASLIPTYRTQLISLPTGTGKTFIAAMIAKYFNTKTLILAHRNELIEQAVDKFTQFWNADIGVIKARRHEEGHQVTVASVQSLHKRRLERMTNDFGLVITDEAHHAAARSYKDIYAWLELMVYENGRYYGTRQDNCPVHIGLTATPNRTDGAGLSHIFDTVAYERGILEFMPDYLCDLRIIRRDSGVNVDGIRRSAGDLNCNELGDLLNTRSGNGLVVDFYNEYASDRNRTLVFCADIAHVRGLAQAFRDAGISCGSIDSQMHQDDRDKVLEAFRNGEIKVLTNCGILTEGFDMPAIDCILLARPTTSELLLRQMIGRGTRPHDEKDDCLIGDIACVSERWDLVSPTTLFGVEETDGERTVREMTQNPRPRLAANEVEFEEAIAGVYDTRTPDRLSPGRLAWVNNRWHGYTLATSRQGRIRITADENMLAYSAYHMYTYDDGNVRQRHICRSVPLETAFSMAESYLNSRADAPMQYLRNNVGWRQNNDPATDRQINAIRTMGGQDYLKFHENGSIRTTKNEASRLIAFLGDI